MLFDAFGVFSPSFAAWPAIAAFADFLSDGASFDVSGILADFAVPEKPAVGLKITAAEVEKHICKLTKKDLTPSQIGVILRNSHGIGPNSM
jgi:hypothetical protein